MEKVNLTGFTQEELEQFAVDHGEKSFRGRQLFSWIYQRKATDFAEMTDLSKALRNKFQDLATIGQLQIAEKSPSPASDSIKYLFRLHDGNLIESVFISERNRRTLCVSSQVGCALKCTFCATGKLGFKRNLTAGEIVDQVICVERDTGLELTNIVFMGMGEPFQNYENVIQSAYLMKHENGIAIGARHIVISTVGIIPALYRYADEGHRFKLAISLHSPFNDDRQKLIPVSAKYDVDKLVDAVKYYMKKSRHRPTFQYVLIDGVNDRMRDAHGVRKLLQGIPCKVNLIPYNPTVPAFKRPSREHVDQFARWLMPIHAPISVRWSKGDDIEAACGQLAGKFVKAPEMV
ncbi:MAG: 23S rRNA (adenine(2503)-C(2))-methyltransferase RlmN [Actinobacteria bacterium]|nr:23S rRNA (adenine(2503)-C(2))-methyltransferase RlmN [Actinomycetota bacterium]